MVQIKWEGNNIESDFGNRIVGKQPHQCLTQVWSEWWNRSFKNCPCCSCSSDPGRAAARLAWWTKHNWCDHEHLQRGVQDHRSLAGYYFDVGQCEEPHNWKDRSDSPISTIQTFPCFPGFGLAIFDTSVSAIETCTLWIELLGLKVTWPELHWTFWFVQCNSRSNTPFLPGDIAWPELHWTFWWFLTCSI